MSPKQLAQLHADLEANRDKAHIFITMHYPIHAKDQGPPDSKWDDRLYPQSREALVEMFTHFDNIAYVMAAHEHLYYNPQAPDDVTDVPSWKTGDPIVYLVSGGAGAPLNDGKWGFHHYLVFTVDGAQCLCQIGKAREHWLVVVSAESSWRRVASFNASRRRARRASSLTAHACCLRLDELRQGERAAFPLFAPTFRPGCVFL